MPVRDQIRQFIRDSFLVDDFEDDQSFLGTGIVDSLGIVQLVAFVESAFGLKVPDGDLLPENLDSVSRLAAYVDRRCRGQAA